MLVHHLFMEANKNVLSSTCGSNVTYGQLQAEVVRYRNYLYCAGFEPGTI